MKLSKKAVPVVMLGAVLAAWAMAELMLSDKAATALNGYETVRLPIIMYHSVTDEGDSPAEHVISPSMLEQDMQYIKRQGFNAVTVNEVIDYVNGGADLPEKPIMLTFDDGYYNNLLNAYPLIEEYDMKMVLSPIGSVTERFTEVDEQPHESWSYCTESDLKTLCDSGRVELQNHSYDFHELSPRRGCLKKSGEGAQTYERTFREDTQRAQDIFTALGTDEPTCYVYPYGALNDETEELVKALGFEASLGCESGCNVLTRGDSQCLYRMKRYNRDGRRSAQEFWNGVMSDLERG